jgi:hypothetical protein
VPRAKRILDMTRTSIGRRALGALSAGGLTVLLGSCSFDPAYRDIAAPLTNDCELGQGKCSGTKVMRCEATAAGNRWVVTDNCGEQGLVCAPTFLTCTKCIPNEASCDGLTAVLCDENGAAQAVIDTCDAEAGEACRTGECVNLCQVASVQQSNVGCEYWAVDLDNAMIDFSQNAAAQQFAVVVSNVEPDVAAQVVIEQDDAPVGSPAQTRIVGTATIAPHNLDVFKLGPREVDGSEDGTFDTGTGTALTRHAYRITSNVPIVAYQFNPLENAGVFSNDASQLLPVSGLNGFAGRAYVVASWPQTIALSPIPTQNFGDNLRAFLAIVGTRPNTKVHIKTKARIIPGGPLPEGLPVNGEADVMLQPFEVLNLETGDFNADFTGSFIDADQPIAVFPGSEASDAPFFETIADRFCCADHLEEQGTPVRTVGKSYVLARMPNRTRAVVAAGGNLGTVDEPEYYRVVATHDGRTHVETTLPPPWQSFDLNGEGDFVTITAHQDFKLDADKAVIVTDTQASQQAAGIPTSLPGGDPSLVYVAPREQWRADYVLLTPDKYAFDFLVITAPESAHVYVDGTEIGPEMCEVAPADGLTAEERGSDKPTHLAYRCQLSFPVVDPTGEAPDNVHPGRQNDGVHRVQADLPVGVTVYGFDAFVSYAYAGGTQLTEINIK